MVLFIHFTSFLGLILLAVNGAHCSSINELRAVRATRDAYTCGNSKNDACSAQCNGDFSDDELIILSAFGNCNNFFTNNTFDIYFLGVGPLAACNGGQSCDECLGLMALSGGLLSAGDNNAINMCCSEVGESGPDGNGTDDAFDRSYICSSYSDNCSDCTGSNTCNCGCYGQCNSQIDEYNSG